MVLVSCGGFGVVPAHHPRKTIIILQQLPSALLHNQLQIKVVIFPAPVLPRIYTSVLILFLIIIKYVFFVI